MLDVVLFVTVGILIAVIVALVIVIRGFVLSEDQDNKTTVGYPITGTEIELIRRKMVGVGMKSITRTDIFNMMATIRAIHLGTYTDKDPYMPADPYEDVHR